METHLDEMEGDREELGGDAEGERGSRNVN